MSKGLWIVVGLAAVMRLSFLGLIEFKADEALTVLSLREWVKQPRLIEAGLISSTGVKNFPLFQYLLLPAAMVSTDPRWLSGVIAAVNVIMVGWFYVATKRAFGEKVALVGGLLLAVAPYPVLFSRKIWAQDLVMILAVPIYDLLLKKKPHNFWLGLLLTLQAQLHGSGLFFAIVVMVWLTMQKKFGWQVLVGTAVGLIPAIPYFISGSFSPPMSDYMIDWHHLLLPIKLLSMFSWVEVMGAADFTRFAGGSPAVGVGMLASIVVMMGLGWGAFRHKKMTCLVTGLMLVYMVAGVPARPHYYLVVLPWITLLIGLGLTRLFDKQPLFLRPALTMVVLFYILFGGMFAKYLADNGGVSGDYGIPYQFAIDAVNSVVAPYADRADIQVIRAWAHFDPVLARETNGAMRHFNLAQYFLGVRETELMETELNRAVELDERFAQVTMGEQNEAANDTANEE